MIGVARGLPTGDDMAPASSCENDRPSAPTATGFSLAVEFGASTASEPDSFAAGAASAPGSAGGELSATGGGDGGLPPASAGFSSAGASEHGRFSAMEASGSFLGFRASEMAKKREKTEQKWEVGGGGGEGEEDEVESEGQPGQGFFGF